MSSTQQPRARVNVTSILGDPNKAGTYGYRMRRRRMELLLQRFPDFAEMKVVDLGGDTNYWRAMGLQPAHVTLVSDRPEALSAPEEWMEGLVADACDPSSLEGRSFDLAFSNSVIEHVGGPRYRRGFADVVQSIAPHHWIQTPNRYFPIEPHLRFPGFQFLPPAAKTQLARRWPLSRRYGDANDAALVDYVMEIELLTETELRALFPDSEILHERVAGLTKSLIVTR